MHFIDPSGALAVSLLTAAHTHAKYQAYFIHQKHYHMQTVLFYVSENYCLGDACSMT